MSASEAEGLDDETLVATMAAQRVLTRDATPVRLRHAWGDKPVALVFVRHFGCLFCHQTVSDILEVAPQIVAGGGHVVIVGCGTPDQAARFARDKGIPREGVELYCDPGRESYQAASLERSYLRTFASGEARKAFRGARREGHRITGIFGDVAQLGGVFVIEPPARLRFQHRSRFAGDQPDTSEIVRAFSTG